MINDKRSDIESKVEPVWDLVLSSRFNLAYTELHLGRDIFCGRLLLIVERQIQKGGSSLFVSLESVTKKDAIIISSRSENIGYKDSELTGHGVPIEVNQDGRHFVWALCDQGYIVINLK